MEDLEIAKKRLSERDLTLSIVKEGKVIFETRNRGVSGFLIAIERFRNQLVGASVADRVVGKAIALLCAHGRVTAVYASILSKAARLVFERNKIHAEWDNLVEAISDAEGKGICRFEKVVAKTTIPEDAYRKLKTLQNSCLKK